MFNLMNVLCHRFAPSSELCSAIDQTKLRQSQWGESVLQQTLRSRYSKKASNKGNQFMDSEQFCRQIGSGLRLMAVRGLAGVY